MYVYIKVHAYSSIICKTCPPTCDDVFWFGIWCKSSQSETMDNLQLVTQAFWVQKFGIDHWDYWLFLKRVTWHFYSGTISCQWRQLSTYNTHFPGWENQSTTASEHTINSGGRLLERANTLMIVWTPTMFNYSTWAVIVAWNFITMDMFL